MGLNDKLMHQRLFAEKAGADLGGAMRAHLKSKAKKPKTSGAATARDRSEARLTEALSRVQQCADAANAFWIEGNQAEALAALEDLLAESKATRQAITSHAENFPLEGEVMDGGEPVAESEMVGEDAEAVAMAAGEKSLKRKGYADPYVIVAILSDGSRKELEIPDDLATQYADSLDDSLVTAWLMDQDIEADDWEWKDDRWPDVSEDDRA